MNPSKNESGKEKVKIENQNINLPSKGNFTDVHFDLLMRGNNKAQEKKEKSDFNNVKDIYDLYSRKKEEKE